jgi:hypothetical protein
LVGISSFFLFGTSAQPCTATANAANFLAPYWPASLGCGDPTAVAELRCGERVLDLGSCGGIDVLLSARRVGRPARRTGWT